VRGLVTRFAIASLVAIVAGVAAQSSEAGRSAGQVVRIDGSNGVLPLATALAKAFESASSRVPLTLGAGLGGKARLDALAAGSIDIALASHGLDFADLERRGMKAHRVAVTPVVFAVRADLSFRALAAAELCGVYAGKTNNFSVLGGPDLLIRPFLRPESEVDTEIVRASLPCFKSLVLGAGVTFASTTGDMARAIQETPGAIGLTTATVVRQSTPALRALSIDDVEPTAENVVAGRYALSRPAYFVTLTSPPTSVMAFLEFVRSERGASSIRESGALPVR
jgi:phosphate transport system substrate-binding protein